jgi:hypothetical protein
MPVDRAGRRVTFAARLGHAHRIPGNVSRNRLFRGWSEREALTVPVGERVGHPARLVTYDGRTRTIDDWARVTGLSRGAIHTG